MIANFQMLHRQAAEKKKNGEIIGVTPDGAPIRAESPGGKKRAKKGGNSASKMERAAQLNIMNALGMTAKDLAAVHFQPSDLIHSSGNSANY